jgi:hypothetical protein
LAGRRGDLAWDDVLVLDAAEFDLKGRDDGLEETLAECSQC